MTDSLPVHKHVVPDVDGASRERNPAFCEAQVTAQLGLAGQHKGVDKVIISRCTGVRASLCQMVPKALRRVSARDRA